METFLTIFGYKLTYFEFFGSVFNLVSIFMATKANLWNWLGSIIGQIFFFFLFWKIGLYANAILQIYYTYVCIMAIFYWKKTDMKTDKGLRWMSTKLRKIWSISTILSIFILYYIIKQIIPSENLFLDVLVTVLSIVGVNLLSLKYIESWLVWVITDIIGIFLFGYSGVYLIMIEYVIITVLAFYGLRNWIKISEN